MKKYLKILGARGLIASTFQAAAISPDTSYFEDFRATGEAGGVLPAGWVTYGNGEVPMPEWQEMFGNTGEGPYYRVLNINGTWGAFSNSSFVEDVQADEWLVTPPIKVKSDDELLLLTVTGYGAAKANDFMVFLSETGNTRESFTDIPVAVSSIYGSSISIKQRQVPVHLTGYAGKEIYLAFVNRSKDSALLGLNEIYISPYILKVTDRTPKVVPAGSEVTVSLTADIRTTCVADGLTAVLTTSDGNVQKVELNNKISITGKQFDIVFPEALEVDDSGLEYTVTITPNYASASSTKVSGVIQTPQKTYTPVAVIEELTGSWCGYCPRGMAFLDYFSDKYNDENGRAYGIGIHAMDLMTMEDSQYLTNVQEDSKSEGFPHAFFQRTVGADPGSPELVEQVMKTPCYSAIKIKKVEFDGEAGDKFDIDFSVENAYDSDDIGMRVAFVLVEDKVRSLNTDYSQANNFSGISKAAITKTYGEELWPYFKFFCESPQKIPASKMVYDHVARGIYPNYYGATLNASCTACQEMEFKYEFVCPDNVMDTNNVAIIALLLDSATGKIITADRMSADNFGNQDVAVQDVAADDIEISGENGVVRVAGGSNMSVSVYGIDGTLLGMRDSDGGLVEIPLNTSHKIVIVKVNSATGSVARKVAM